MAVWGPGTGSEAKNAISFSAAFSISQACRPAGLIFLTLGIEAIGIAAITVINIYKVRLCDNCGATTGLFRKEILHDATCRKCEAPLRCKYRPLPNRPESKEAAAIELTKAENRYVSNPDDSFLKISYMF